jgi:hypothetical protein
MAAGATSSLLRNGFASMKSQNEAKMSPPPERLLWDEVKEFLKQRGENLNQEVRNYPSPIAVCDEQLTDLLERRAKAVRARRRMDALAEQGLSRDDYAALVREFIEAPNYSRDETESNLKARLTAQLRELGSGFSRRLHDG